MEALGAGRQINRPGIAMGFKCFSDGSKGWGVPNQMAVFQIRLQFLLQRRDWPSTWPFLAIGFKRFPIKPGAGGYRIICSAIVLGFKRPPYRREGGEIQT